MRRIIAFSVEIPDRLYSQDRFEEWGPEVASHLTNSASLGGVIEFTYKPHPFSYIYTDDLRVGDEIEDNGEVIKVTKVEVTPECRIAIHGVLFSSDGVFTKDEVVHVVCDGQRLLLLNRVP